LRLEPFRGLMLAPGRVGDPASARLFARPYRDAHRRLRRWENDGRLLRDDVPAVYLHEYSDGGLTVRGLVGALDLSRRTADPRECVVLPHEGIHPAQAAGLADRMSQMELNPAPILLVHRGPQAVRDLLALVRESTPDHDYEDRTGQHHRVWAIREPSVLAGIDTALLDARALVADGHHRYAAYLRMQQEQPGGPVDRGLAMLVDQDDTPLFLGAIHRVLAGTTFDDFRVAGEDLGTFREADQAASMAALDAETLAVTDGQRWGTLAFPQAGTHAPVEVLHTELLPGLPRPPHRIVYHHSVEETLDELDGAPGLALLMPAPDFDVVGRILAAERLLPEKATSFQPKPSLGVLMRSLRDE
jgi:uncharacterized protein (DUF1015 family)